jgi:chemotaxis family two-component system response regulator Rcp1
MYVDVLLIEDNLGEAVLIRDAINRLSVQINLHLALDGHQALLMLNNSNFQPHLIVLDLNIPKISGTVLLERWKNNQTPVVVLSSSLDPGTREFCLASGALEFVAKPVEIGGVPGSCRENHRTVGGKADSAGRSEVACVGNSA